MTRPYPYEVSRGTTVSHACMRSYLPMTVATNRVRRRDVYDRAGFGHPIVRGSRPGARGRRLQPRIHRAGVPHRGRHDRRGRADGAARPGLPRARAAGLLHRHRLPAAPARRGRLADQVPRRRGRSIEGTPAVELDPRLGVDPSDVRGHEEGAPPPSSARTSPRSSRPRRSTRSSCAGPRRAGACARASSTACSTASRPSSCGDCVGDRAAGPHEANLFDMARQVRGRRRSPARRSTTCGAPRPRPGA